MTTLITHLDSDGILSGYILNKYVEKTQKIYFSSPTYIRDTIARSIMGSWDPSKLYILDITGDKLSLRVASVYYEAIWIDHHIWSEMDNYPNVKVYVSPEKSAAQVLANVYKISDPMVDAANHIDQNRVENDFEKDLRDLISAVRNAKDFDYTRFFENIIYAEDSEKIKDIIKENYNLIESFRKEMDEIKNELSGRINKLKIKDKRVIFVEPHRDIPVYKIEEMFDGDEWDILVVKYTKMNKYSFITKIEFRSREEDVQRIAKFFNGGGHKNASGATINGLLTKIELVNALNLFL